MVKEDASCVDSGKAVCGNVDTHGSMIGKHVKAPTVPKHEVLRVVEGEASVVHLVGTDATQVLRCG